MNKNKNNEGKTYEMMLERKLIKKINEKLEWSPIGSFKIKKENDKVIFSHTFAIGKPIIKCIVEVFQENRDLDNNYNFLITTNKISFYSKKCIEKLMKQL